MIIKKDIEILAEEEMVLSNNSMKRFFSSLVIGALFITSIFLYRPLFYGLMYIVATFMLLEWYNMSKGSRFYHSIGQVLVIFAISSLIIISSIDSTGWLLFTFFSIIWSVDTTAMIGGKFFQGFKLAPKISPNKTFSGLIVGLIFGVLVPHSLVFFPLYEKPYIIPEQLFMQSVLYFTIALLAQISDLFISFFKRKFDIKDSGNIIPGHGGMLDRFDSIILTSPLILMYLFVHAQEIV